MQSRWLTQDRLTYKHVSECRVKQAVPVIIQPYKHWFICILHPTWIFTTRCLCRFCIQTARVTWSILNLETSESPDPTDTDSSRRFTSHTQRGQVSFFNNMFSCALNIKLSNETELNIQTSKNSRSSSLCFLLSCLCLRAVSDRGASPAGLQLLLNLPDLPFQAGVERELGEPPGSRGCRRGNHSV